MTTSFPLTEPAALQAAMHANLNALALRLGDATRLAIEARSAMGDNRRSLAIGTLLPMRDTLQQALALFEAIQQLNRAVQSVYPSQQEPA
jgi:hypothetical protein